MSKWRILLQGVQLLSGLPAKLLSSKGKVFLHDQEWTQFEVYYHLKQKKKFVEDDNSKDELPLLLSSFYIKGRCIFPDSDMYHYAEAHLSLHSKFFVKVHPLELLLCVCSDCLPVVKNASFITSATVLSKADQKLHILKTHRRDPLPLYSLRTKNDH